MNLDCGCAHSHGKHRMQFRLECEVEYDIEFHCGSPRHDEGYGGLSREVTLRRMWLDGEEVTPETLSDVVEGLARAEEFP